MFILEAKKGKSAVQLTTHQTVRWTLRAPARRGLVMRGSVGNIRVRNCGYPDYRVEMPMAIEPLFV
jgi:hypothetical protein